MQNELNKWLERAQTIVDAQYGTSLSRPTLFLKRGKKYIKVVAEDQGGSRYVFCFVDESGNILKGASWNKPAKGVRGNIFEQGKEGVSAYGALYLR